MPRGVYARTAETPAATLARLVSHVSPEPNSGCWLWTGCHIRGYGRLDVNGRAWLAHRWMYEHARGPIPPGLQLDHLCRTRFCVNPDHLEPVTNAENSRRGLTGVLYRERTHCKNGHRIDPSWTRTRGGAFGRKRCIVCITCEQNRHYRNGYRTTPPQSPHPGSDET